MKNLNRNKVRKQFGLLAAVLLMISAFPMMASAQTYLFNWDGTVRYTGGSYVNVVAFNKIDCDAKFNFAAANPPAGEAYDPFTSSPCSPNYFRLPILVHEWPWEIGCIVCGFLDDDLTHLIYPEHFDKVKRLKEEFQIDSYIEELNALQRGYDLQGFEQAMGELEQEMLQR